MNPRTYLPIGLAALVAVSAANVAPAQLIAYDPFNQTAPFQLNGTASSGGGAVWPGGSTNTWGPFPPSNGGQVVPGSLAYGPLQTGGNSVAFTWFNPYNASLRSLVSNRGGGPPDLWVSFLMAGTAAGNQGLSLYFGGAGGSENLWLGTPGGTAYGFRVGPAAAADSTTHTVSTGVLADGATHFVAAHLVLSGPTTADNSVTLYVDPDFASLGTGTAPTGGSSVGFSGLNSFPFEQLTLENRSGVASDTVRFDEIRIGSTWALVSPVPEPSTLLLVGGGFAAVGIYRRARRSRNRRI
ncbi:MAG TPA: PEP-CTERM sorting domain-containing protein [Gemmataceae bacterium]|jgi:hypothetical protein